MKHENENQDIAAKVADIKNSLQELWEMFRDDVITSGKKGADATILRRGTIDRVFLQHIGVLDRPERKTLKGKGSNPPSPQGQAVVFDAIAKLNSALLQAPKDSMTKAMIERSLKSTLASLK